MPRKMGRTGEQLERRSHSRYPINLDVTYSLIGARRVVETGYGRTVNVSSGGVLFQSEHPLAADRSIELAIAWPFPPGKSPGLTLWVSGRIIRVQGNGAAVKVDRQEFRTRALSVAVES
jgi:hypothetical protein